ncbi:MAG: hypothetical protein K0V04_06210 [Deltaproteobacteria bacterium]|nr:hypothetical protein [Deltaproteobacteria bacterium]
MRSLLLLTMFASACEPRLDEGDPTTDGPSCDTTLPLVDRDRWTPSRATDDPRPAHRPTTVDCPALSWLPEYEGIEVSTERCNYLSLTQPLRHDLALGDRIELEAWHQPLANIDGSAAQAHYAVYVGTQPLWEVDVAIPADANAWLMEFDSPVQAAAGTPVTLHLHNHGFNTWNFNRLAVDGCP